MRSLLGALAATTLALGATPSLSARTADPQFTLAVVRAEAAKGQADAIATLGWMYETGKGVVEDDAKAVSLYRTAIAHGDAFGQWRMGVMIDEGAAQGTSQQAVALFRQAATQKSAGATASLGVMYATGRGVERDYEAAMRYYQAAARMGSAHGIEGIGVLYANGQGVERDMGEALAHWLVAAAAGDEDAMKLLMEHMPASSTPEAGPIYDRANAIADAYGTSPGDDAQAASAQ
ncbi:MAG: sel1 repeat family protein [Qipengyuania sp.]|jgi:TPR repeat protein|nr:sel1 repeat family protein [Qipengyuania sp.]